MIINTLKRFGITTGAAAAAASKASTILLVRNEIPKSVTIPTPIGLRLEIPVESVEKRDEFCCAEVKKFSGDNPDILDGLIIQSCVKFNGNEIEIEGGEGVGIVTRTGLKIGIGERAINPIVKEMIKNAIREVTDRGVKVIIQVPNGKEIAPKTMNEVVGVVEGISILGTTGIETPVSDEDYIEHISCELNSIKTSHKHVVLAPGNTAAKLASKIFDKNTVVKVGDRIGDSIRIASSLFQRIILAGLPAKLLKVYAGIFNTHNSFGDARIESLTHASLLSNVVDHETLIKIANSSSVEEAFSYMTKEQRRVVMKIVAERILSRIRKINDKVSFCVIIFDYDEEELCRVGCE